MTPEKEFKITIEHRGVRYHSHSIFHDADTLGKVGHEAVQDAGRRMGVQMMEAIDQWSKGVPPPQPQRSISQQEGQT